MAPLTTLPPKPLAVATATALAEVARPLILTEFGPESCVAATRIGIDALTAFGVTSTPLPVWCRISNAEMLQLRSQPPDVQHTFASGHTKDSPGGPWIVDIGNPDDDTADGAGHVIIGIPLADLIVDLSLDQASRPHKHILLTQPLVATVPTTFRTQPGTRVAFTNDQGVEVAYQLLPTHRYRQSLNWRRSSVRDGGPLAFRRVTGQIIRAIRSQLADTVNPAVP